MKKIYIYTGQGAYQARDIENCLSVFELDYMRLCAYDFSRLQGKSIFIVPGGEIKSYLPAWGPKRIKTIRNFVSKGGIYIGICAGVYVAGVTFRKRRGLGLFPESLVYRKHQGLVRVKDEKGKSLELIAENGPDLRGIPGARVLLRDDRARPQAVKLKFGIGSVYLFSSHPEGSIYYNKLPQLFSGAKYFISLLKGL